VQQRAWEEPALPLPVGHPQALVQPELEPPVLQGLELELQEGQLAVRGPVQQQPAWQEEAMMPWEPPWELVVLPVMCCSYAT
jgi:hypothetical protein